MRRYMVVSVVMTAAVLLGCSDTGKDEDAVRGDSAAESGHVWDEQVQTLEKARQVEQKMLDAHEGRMESMEKQNP